MNPITEYRLDHLDVCVEADLVSVRPHGSLEQEQVPQLLALMKQMKDQTPDKLFLLLDLRDGTGLSSVMRRMLSQVMVEFMPAAIAVYGAHGELRGTHALLMGAVTGVGGRRPNEAYFQTEAEARQWLTAERQRLT